MPEFIPFQEAARFGRRAQKIVERVAPLPVYKAHGFMETALWIDQAKYRGQRDQLYKTIYWRLAAKGGYPKEVYGVERYNER